MIKEADLLQWLATQKVELIEISDKLIMEDAPKNRFSVNCGERRFIEKIENVIPDLVKKTRES